MFFRFYDLVVEMIETGEANGVVDLDNEVKQATINVSFHLVTSSMECL